MPRRPTRTPDSRAAASASVFEPAFHNSPAMHTVTRVSDRILVEVNEAFLTTLGYRREEVVGRSALEFDFWVHPERSKAFREELFAHGTVRGYEVEIRTKRGELRTVLLSADVVEIAGEPHVVGAGVDITERQKAVAELRTTHERLRQSEERFSKAFRANPAIVALTRLPDGMFVTVNEAFLRETGYAEHEVVGRTATDLNLHLTAEQRDGYLRRIAEQGFARDFEIVIRTKRGELHTLLASGERCDIEGVPHLLTVGLDITGRKETEARLRESEARVRESEARFSTAFHASPLLMTIAALHDVRFVEVNDAFAQALGLTRAEALGKTSDELALWVEPAERRRFYERLTAAGSLRNVECLIRRRDGAVRNVLLSGEIVEIHRAPHLLTFGIDITERKLAEAEQERALRKERELRQLKTDFVSLVSHEFRTPLEIIMSSVDNLDRYHDRLPVEKRRELHGTINKSVRRMAGMMEEMLLLGRLDSGGTDFRPAPLDLAAFCRRVCDEMESATNARCPIAVRLDHPPGHAHADEAVLRHILTNLLSNAVKYSDAGQPVELRVGRAGAHTEFRVVDRGRGIPEADQRRLFQAFHRGSNVRQIPGTGLGLLIVRRCVALHGGEIEFTSAEGRGTTFVVRLRLPAPPETDAAPAPA